MPFVRVAKKKFLLKQFLILTPLSLSGIFLVNQAINSISQSGNSRNTQTVQSAPVSSQRNAAPSGRTAAPPPPPSDPGDPFAGGNPGGTPGPVGAVPVDGGLSLLLAAGLGYGARRAFQHHSKKYEI